MHVLRKIKNLTYLYLTELRPERKNGMNGVHTPKCLGNIGGALGFFHFLQAH